MRKLLLTNLVLLALTQLCNAQQILDGVYTRDEKESILIEGVIKSANTQQPLDSVTIFISGGDGTNSKLYVDTSGNFKILLGKGNYKLIYERENYLQLVEEMEFIYVPNSLKMTKYLEMKKY
jgi:hypothetical protein